MSLISKIKSAYKKVKSVAKKAASYVNNAASSLTASASNAADKQISKNQAQVSQIIASQGTGKSTKNPAANSTPLNPTTALSNLANVFARSNPAGTSNPFLGANSTPNPAANPGATKTISAGKQSVSSGGGNQTTSDLSAAYQAPTTLTTAAMSSSGGTGTSPNSGGSTSVVTVPSSPGSTNPQIDNTQMAGSLAGLYEAQPDGTLKLVEQKEPTVEDKVKDRAKLLEDYMGVKESVYDDREVKRAMKERQRIQQALQAPTSELNAVIAKQNTDLLAHRKMVSENGGTTTGFGGIESAINYNAAIRALPLQASIASLQGDLELAQDYLQELVTVKTDQINRQYEYRKMVTSSIAGIIEEEDKRAYDKVTKEDDRAYKDEQELVKTQKELSQMVMQNAPESVRTSVNNRIWAAGSIQQALQAAGQYGVEANTQLKQLDNGDTGRSTNNSRR